MTYEDTDYAVMTLLADNRLYWFMLDAITQQTGADGEQVWEALGWLTRAGLVEYQDFDPAEIWFRATDHGCKKLKAYRRSVGETWE